MYLLALDSTGTQPYIFGSNRLRHNIGASHLVARATGQWALEAVQKAASPQRTNVKDAAALEPQDSDDPTYWIEENKDIAAEVLYAGGGNVVVLFREKDVANDFRECLSQELIERAPELDLVECGKPFKWAGAKWAGARDTDLGSTSPSDLSETLDAALRALGREKDARSAPSSPVNRSVTQPGQIRGQPAVAMQDPPPGADDDPYPISAEAKAKEEHLHRANQRLENLLPPPNGYAYPFELGKLGQAEGEQSFIAVVHADGDRMGKLLQEVAKKNPREEASGPNRAFIRRMREFSEVVRGAALDALKDMIGGLHAFIEEHRDGNGEVELPYLDAPLRLDRRDGDLLLPLRPIVFGGDDVTFVCDGRLGLALVARYVRCFEARFEKRAKESDLLQTLPKATASAGVSIVKTHYPFSRAYDLAEELTRSAKDRRQEEPGAKSYMDWHVSRSDLAGSLHAVRAPYRLPAQAGSKSRPERFLFARPVTVTGGGESEFDHWETLRGRIRNFQEYEGARSKVKGLGEKLRQGRKAVVRSYVEKHDLKHLLDGNPTGYHGNETPYLDVLELMEFAVLDDDLESCNDANEENN